MRRPTVPGPRHHGRHGSRLPTYMLALALCALVLFMHMRSSPRGVAVVGGRGGALDRAEQAATRFSASAGSLGRRSAAIGAALASPVPGLLEVKRPSRVPESRKAGLLGTDSAASISEGEADAQADAATAAGASGTTSTPVSVAPRVAVLVPIWRDAHLIDSLVANLSAHLDAQGRSVGWSVGWWFLRLE